MHRQSWAMIALCAAVLWLLGPHDAAGQASAGPQPGRATLVGALLDSIHGGPLAGATVVIDGTALSAISDAAGRFRIDSIPPGSYRIGVFHPMLDSLGMTIGSQAVRFGPDSVREAVLSTPSAESLIGEWCPPATRRFGPAAVVGRVIDPETAGPIAGARVTIVWEETELDIATITRRTVPRVRSATTDDTGRFALCGMTTETRGTLQAQRGRDKTPELPVAMEGRTLAMHAILLGKAASTSAAGVGGGADSSGVTPPATRTGTASVTGRILDAAGHAISGARVSVDGTGISTVSDSAGAFTMSRVPAGSWIVAARRVGFRPSEVTVHLLPRRTERVTLTLEPGATELSPVVVAEDAMSAGLERVGFAQRKRSGMGRYLTSDDIADRRPLRTTELFETIPGIRVVPNGRGGHTLRATRDARGGCVSIFIDGLHYPQTGAGDLDMTLPPHQISAVEVYTASNRPSEFTASGQTQCAAVVFWTKTRTGDRR